MADCFWTDFVGCAEDCASGPPESIDGVIGDSFMSGGDVFFRVYDSPDGECTSGPLNNVATVCTVLRCELTADEHTCGQAPTSTVPSWMPSGYTCGGVSPGTPGASYSADSMSFAISLNPASSVQGVFTPADLLAAMGVPDWPGGGFVAYVKADVGGKSYYGTFVYNNCF